MYAKYKCTCIQPSRLYRPSCSIWYAMLRSMGSGLLSTPAPEIEHKMEINCSLTFMFPNHFSLIDKWHIYMPMVMTGLILTEPHHAIPVTLSTSAVVGKRFVDKLGDKTAILRKYMSTKIPFCLHNNVLSWKRKDSFKKQTIDKISLQKGLTVCEKRCKRVQQHASMLSQPLFTLPVLMIHRVTWCLDFGRTSPHLFPELLPFDSTCRQRNLSSTTALLSTSPCFHIFKLVIGGCRGIWFQETKESDTRYSPEPTSNWNQR